MQDRGGRLGLSRSAASRQVIDLGAREGLRRLTYEQRRPTGSTEPTLWSSVRRTSSRAPRDPFSGPLRRARSDVRRSAGERSHEAYRTLGNADVRMMDAPPPGYRQRGEWDWYRHLTPQEQARLRRSWFRPRHHPGYGASGPDQVAQRWARAQGGDVGSGAGHDKAIGEWLELTRVADAGRAVSRGRLPNGTAYGNIDLRNVAPHERYDAGRLLEGDREAATHYLAALEGEEAEEARYREERERAAPTYVPPAFAREDF